MKNAWLILILLVVFGFLGYRGYQRIPWINVAAFIHSQRGSIDCGQVQRSTFKPSAKAAEAAVNCAMSASQTGHPFVVTFTAQGTDEVISNTIAVDSKGSGVEVFYATGLVARANVLLKHSCAMPIQLLRDTATTYPSLHCAPWPPSRLEKDHLLW